MCSLFDLQGPEFNGYLVGRGNAKEVDLNRNFPDLNALMYYYEKHNGQNHHLPLPDNWELQVIIHQCHIHLYRRGDNSFHPKLRI